jgi:type II secretory pathway pseudopilin PulG
MRGRRTRRNERAGEQGYALVLIMFFLALLALTTVMAAPTVISSIQREKEKEMVWRGRQYTRAIRMYYAKMKRFPTSLDDLTKPKTGLRFMRQAYKDPMNGTDGTWRLIYVGPNGQLIGSLNPANQASFGMIPGLQGGVGVNPNATLGTSASSFGSSSSFTNTSFGGNSSFGNSSFGSSSFGNSTASGTANAAGGQGFGSTTTGTTDPNAQNGGSSDQLGVPQPLQMMDSSNTIGGNIIGVGSKIDKKSFLWYQKAKNYRQFEFIWDPSKDMGLGGASRGIGNPVQNLNGNNSNTTNPNGTTPGSGFGANPGSSSPQPNQNFNGNQDPNSNPPLQAPPGQ